jgi:hypothetical protein
MSAQDLTPCNTDILQASKFIFAIPRLTATQFFCQAVNLPDISTSPKIQVTPILDLAIPGDKIIFGDLNIEFLLDEELSSWLAISNWMRGIAEPRSQDEYKNLKHLSKYSEQVKHPQYADAELTVLSASNSPTMKFLFTDLFPISLSGINFDVRVGSERTMTASATFRYKYYDVE